jgi:Pex19 protein family
MGQLMSKEVLYEPLNELNDKVGSFFPLCRTSSADETISSSLPISPRIGTNSRRRTWHDMRRNMRAPHKLLTSSMILGTEMTTPK